jgi:NAD(P)-dependent dehydrogenase (short-subunit alcohol dehydrogenase family)
MNMSKTIVITGSSSGIGAEAARQLTRQGHHVVIVGRSADKTRAIAREIGSEYFLADFTDLLQVRDLAVALGENYPRIDVLANNAGGIFDASQRTVDGFETMFQVNHLAPFLLTNLLITNLLQARASVIQTSSNAARLTGNIDLDDLNSEKKTSAMRVYGDVKLENILFMKELHRRFNGEGISAAAFHPGTIATDFASELAGPMSFIYKKSFTRRFLRSPVKGAGQLTWLATGTPGEDWESGEYYENYKPAKKTHAQAEDPALAAALWDLSFDLLGLRTA